MRQPLTWLVGIGVLMMLESQPTFADLLKYVQAPDAAYKWDKTSEIETPQGTVTNLHMVSQVWEGVQWEHRLQIFRPKQLAVQDAAVLLITGGSGNDKPDPIAVSVAAQTGCVFAVLWNIPNQPLFGDLHEDGLIAHTFIKYLETGDEDWPLLFPMVKSALRAMDATQAYAQQTWQQPIKRFVVTGASKRGWTTWLTAAADPERVAAIMPMVYDNLNLGKQMQHQLEVWGKYSEQIDDYTKLGVQEKMTTDAGKHLTTMVDPYTFRDCLTMPKLIINGTNDPYWAQDALNLYWGDLKGEKRILYVPNVGHGLNDYARVLGTAGGFVRCITRHEPLPTLRWQHSDADGKARLALRGDATLQSAHLWVVHSATQDFRQSKWGRADMQVQGTKWVGEVAKPKAGWMALFGEATVEQAGATFNLSTQIRVVKGGG